MHYEDFRREYTAGGLNLEMLDACPMRQFEHWLEQSVKADLEDPTAMVLATIDERGHPWQRIVLLKGLSHGGFVFYTNYGSAKAQAIAHNPRVSLHFPWNELDRQVIVAGETQHFVPPAIVRRRRLLRRAACKTADALAHHDRQGAVELRLRGR